MNQRPGNEWHRFCLLRAHYLRLCATFVPCPVLQGGNSAPQYLNISGPVSWSFTLRNERVCSSFCSLSRVWKLSELVAISQILQECLFWGLGPLWASAAGHPPAHIAGLLSWPSVRLKCSLSLGWRDTGYPRWTSGHKHYRLSEFLVQGPFSTGCSRWLLVALELCLKSSKIVFPQPTTPAEPPTHSPVTRSCSGNICHMVGLSSSDPDSYVHMDCFWVQVAIKKKKPCWYFRFCLWDLIDPDLDIYVWMGAWYLVADSEAETQDNLDTTVKGQWVPQTEGNDAWIRNSQQTIRAQSYPGALTLRLREPENGEILEPSALRRFLDRKNLHVMKS